MEGEEEGQFLSRIIKIEWRLGRSGGKMADVRTLEGRTRIHKEKVFLRRGLAVGVKMILE